MRRWPALAVALLLATTAAPARAGELSAEVEVGWDGLYVEEEWTPVRVTLSLPAGSPALRGRVACEPLPLERVPGSDAPFELPAVAPGADDPRVQLLLAVPARGDLSYTVRVEDDLGRPVLSVTPRELPRRLDKDRLVVLARRDAGLLALEGVPPGAGQPPPQFGPGPRPPRAQPAMSPPSLVRLARVAPEQLPERAFLYGGIAALVLVDGRGARDLALDEARVAALEGFVRAGGALVVIGGSGTPFWSDAPLDRLLPVDARGDRVEVPPAELDFLGGDRRRPPIVAVRVAPRPGAHVEAGTLERPLAVVRDLGRGHVTFLAFDPDQRALRGAPDLGSWLARFLPARPTAPAVRRDKLRELTADALLDRAPIGPAGVAGLAAAAGVALVILGPVAARRRKGPARALLAPALSGALAAVIVLVAWATAGPTEVASIAYVFAESGAPGALAVVDRLHFAGEATSLALELADDATVLPLEAPRMELVSFRRRRSTLRVAPGSPARVEPIEVAAKGAAWVRVGGWVPAPVRLRARAADGKLELFDAPGPVPAGLAIHDDRKSLEPIVFETPALAAGARATVALSGRTATELLAAEASAPPLWERPHDDAVRPLLLRTLRAAIEEARAATTKGPPRYPRTWVALPVPAPRLARSLERGAELPEGRSFGALLVAAEEEP